MPINANIMPKQEAIPFHRDYLSVSGGHQLYFAEYGQPDGPVAVVLHGGPGSGCNSSMLDWFDLSRQRVVLLDQRGAGRSKPAGCLQHNTTQDLIADMEHLRTALKIRQWLVVGGSWGSALGVCYAGSYPEAVYGLVLRGVFLASEREMTWFFQSLRAMMPDAWMHLTTGWNQSERDAVLQSLASMLQNGAPEQQQDAACRWSQYEQVIIQKMLGISMVQRNEESVDQAVKYRLQAHYLSNHCFLTEREIFRSARRLDGMPISIVHGTHDLICPPENVMRLTRFMPHAQVHWVSKGTHTTSDPTIRDALRHAIAQQMHLCMSTGRES